MRMVTEVVASLGLPREQVHSQKDLALLAAKGIPKYAVDHLAAMYSVTLTELAEYLNVTLRTIQGYSKNQLLSAAISDHLIQLAGLHTLGKHTMGEDRFREWLQMYNPALGIKPAELLRTGTGIETVKDELLRIEYGVFA